MVAMSTVKAKRDLRRNHFAWNNDFTLIIELTTTERATAEAFELNKETWRTLGSYYTQHMNTRFTCANGVQKF